jgi:hypothetical protein
MEGQTLWLCLQLLAVVDNIDRAKVAGGMQTFVGREVDWDI